MCIVLFHILYNSTIYRLQGKLLLMPLHWLSEHLCFLLGLSLFAHTHFPAPLPLPLCTVGVLSTVSHLLFILSLLFIFQQTHLKSGFCQRQFNVCSGHNKT